MSGRVTWTPEMVAGLQHYWSKGWTSPAIAARFGKTTSAVTAKIHKLRKRGVAMARRDGGKPDDGENYQSRQAGQSTHRRCLYCSEDFDSSHHGNRICPGCLETGPFTSAMV